MGHVCSQVYVEKGEFELAKQYCKDSPAQIDQVLVKQAEMYFDSEQYVARRICPCKTVLMFPDISLPLLPCFCLYVASMF
jgi:hypothetical protein